MLVYVKDCKYTAVSDMHDVLQFQGEVRKILFSLVEASARILTACPDSGEVSQVIQERLDARAKSEPNHWATSLFKDMGFSEHMASRALHLNR
jgi:hypothetical protein